MTRREKFAFAALLSVAGVAILVALEWLHEIGVIPPHKHQRKPGDIEDMDLDI